MDETLNEVLAAALKDITEKGFTSEAVVAQWAERIKKAAERAATPRQRMEQIVRDFMRSVIRREIDHGGVLRKHPGVSRFVLSKVRPELHDELARRIAASINLIVLNKEEEISKAVRRFSGWATSIPVGGSTQVNKQEEKEHIRKSIAGLKYTERRVLVDQGHKLEAAVSDVVAKGGGAIAAKWVSHWHQAGYDYREDHKDRELESAKLPYLIRDSWAQKKGLIKLAGSKYLDQMTQPGEEVFCRCYLQYIYNLRNLPTEQITAKGQEALAAARAAA